MKIDTTKIEGYADMSPEEKLAALEGYDMDVPAPDHDEIKRLKDAVSRANSEAADYKKQLRAKQTDDEAKAAEDAKAREAMQQELESLRRDKAVGTYRAKFLELGYDAEAAADAAKALQAGDFDKVFAAQAAFIESAKKAAVAGSLDKQPGLTPGDPVGKEAKKQAEIAALRRYMGLPPEKKG